MKSSRLLLLLTSLSFSIGSVASLQAATNEELRKIYTEKKDNIYGVKATLTVTATYTENGKSKKINRPIWSNAVCVGEGLFVLAHASIDPETGEEPGITFTKKLSDLRLINEAGVERLATVVLHDADVGIAFLALTPTSKKQAGEWKDNILDISKDPEVKPLDDTLNISRHNDNLEYKAAAMKGSVLTILSKPRKLYQIMGTAMSSPTFNENGEIIGITIIKKGKPAVPVTLPIKYIRNFTEMAKTQQAELTK